MAGGAANSTDSFTQSKRATYEGFTRFALWGTVIVIGIVALMGIFLL
jgi:hypothetical protein